MCHMAWEKNLIILSLELSLLDNFHIRIVKFDSIKDSQKNFFFDRFGSLSDMLRLSVLTSINGAIYIEYLLEVVDVRIGLFKALLGLNCSLHDDIGRCRMKVVSHPYVCKGQEY